jgi:hypothetical protein
MLSQPQTSEVIQDRLHESSRFLASKCYRLSSDLTSIKYNHLQTMPINAPKLNAMNLFAFRVSTIFSFFIWSTCFKFYLKLGRQLHELVQWTLQTIVSRVTQLIMGSALFNFKKQSNQIWQHH